MKWNTKNPVSYLSKKGFFNLNMSYFARSWNYNVNVEEFKTTYYSIFVITIRHQMKKTEGEETLLAFKTNTSLRNHLMEDQRWYMC